MPIRIAVVQMETVPGAVERNRGKAFAFAREALANNADIVLFHEELLIGYVPNVAELAEPADAATTRGFQALLQACDSRILYGLTERDGDALYISAILVGAEGILANYHKTHLWWKSEGLRHEPAFYRPGERLVTFDVKGHKSGVMICYDGDFPEVTRAYANLGCRLVFWLNNREARGHGEVKDLAYRNSIIIAASCCTGLDETGRPCPGGSNVTGHDGKCLAEIWNKEGVIYADVSPEEVDAARAKNPWFTGQRRDLYI